MNSVDYFSRLTPATKVRGQPDISVERLRQTSTGDIDARVTWIKPKPVRSKSTKFRVLEWAPGVCSPLDTVPFSLWSEVCALTWEPSMC